MTTEPPRPGAVAGQEPPAGIPQEVLDDELLSRLRRGLSVEHLRPLLRHDDPEVVALGTWFASELGVRARPVADDLATLLAHPSAAVRFYAVEAVANAGSTDFAVRIPALLDDPDSAVRWKTMAVLGRVPEEVVERAAAGATDAGRLRWLLGDGRSAAAVRAALDDPDPRRRRVGAVAALRLAGTTTHPLEHAAASGDAEIARFAGDWLRILAAGGPR